MAATMSEEQLLRQKLEALLADQEAERRIQATKKRLQQYTLSNISPTFANGKGELMRPVGKDGKVVNSGGMFVPSIASDNGPPK